jgi:hypothetical protein
MALAYSDEDRPALWMMPRLWEEQAARGQLTTIEREAVALEPQERLRNNFYRLMLAPQALLHQRGRYVFELIRREFQFGEFDFWDCQRGWLRQLFRKVFPARGECLGTVSILAARRPAAFREQQDASIQISQAAGRTSFSGAGIMPQRFAIGDLRFSASGLRWALPSAEPSGKIGLAATVIPRQLRSTRFNLERTYEEFWYCLAQPEYQAILDQGRLPGVDPADYTYPAIRLRPTILLNLVRFTRSMWQTVVVVEIHPWSGEVLSLRWSRNLISAATLSMSPVEHMALCQALHS